VRDLSLTGAGLRVEAVSSAPLRLDAELRLFLKGVGFVRGRGARSGGGFLGCRSALLASVKRDLLIRKIFTSGLDTTAVSTSAFAATVGLLKRIWTVRAEIVIKPAEVAGSVASPAVEKLPAATLRLEPRPPARRLAELAR